MIGINFVYEKDEFLKSVDPHISLSSELAVESFDFDTNSFDDLADYIEFMNFDEYIFFGLGNPQRLIRVVNYLQGLVKIPIKFINQNTASNYLNDHELVHLCDEVNKLSKLNVNEAFLQGYRCFQTNLYPLTLRKGILKHLKVDNLALFLEENTDLLRYFGINSAIYSKNKQNKFLLPIIHLDSDEYDLQFSKAHFLESQDILLQNINDFIHTGKVAEKKVPLNYGTLVGINKFHSLYFHNKNFFLDSEYKYKVGTSGDKYQNIINIASTIIPTIQVPLSVKQLYPTLIHINNVYDDINFITAYNRYKLPPCEFSSFDWIGFTTKKQKIVFNLPTQRVFEVNTLYLSLIHI